MTPRVLFVYQVSSPFILQDRDLLANHFGVREFRWADHRHPARALGRWMVRRRAEFDVVFAWFGDTHASVSTWAARLLGKPSVLVLGGYDVSDLANYGFLSTRAGLRRAQGHFRRATLLLPVSEALRAELVRRFPDAAGKARVLPTGVDVERFRPSGPRDGTVISVAGVRSWTRAWVKGWDRIAEVARALPNVPFSVIGAASEVATRLDPPPNLRTEGPVPQDQLVGRYQKSSVYLQPSRMEGLPNSLMEAMSCGCVPVATPVGGIPELVGDTGFLVDGETQGLTNAIRRALAAPEYGPRARKRVVERFSLDRREKGLVEAIEAVAGAHAR